MKTGSDSVHRHRRGVVADNGDECIAAIPVTAAHPTDVSVQSTRPDQLGECQVREDVNAAVSSALGFDHCVD
jgi:hypothetical protein